MAQTVQEAIAAAKLYSDGQEYVVVKLPSTAITAAAGVVAEVGEPFCGLVVDKDEVTLLLPAEGWNDFQRRLPGSSASEMRYRLITLDVELEPTLVGFMAAISRTLAEAKVSILPIAAYSRDHLFVPTGQFEIAMAALKKLQSGR